MQRGDSFFPRVLWPAQVFTEWPVGSVAYDQPGRTGVEVRGARGGLIRCAAVVVAVQLSQLQEGLTFDPPLPPAHQSALQAMAMGNAAKVRRHNRRRIRARAPPRHRRI